jgi:hypothetical protein
MLVFNGRRQHDHLTRAARRQHKPVLRSAHAGQRMKRRSKSPDFDAQPRAMGFIGRLSSECARNECASRRVFGPCFTKRAYEREQYRTRCERNRRVGIANDMTAGVHNEHF